MGRATCLTGSPGRHEHSRRFFAGRHSCLLRRLARGGGAAALARRSPNCLGQETQPKRAPPLGQAIGRAPQTNKGLPCWARRWGIRSTGLRGRARANSHVWRTRSLTPRSLLGPQPGPPLEQICPRLQHRRCRQRPRPTPAPPFPQVGKLVSVFVLYL